MNVMQLNTDIYNSLGELPFELFHYACHMPPHRSFFFAAYEIYGYLQQLSCYPGTGFGICQGIVVHGEVVTAIGGYGLELMVGEERTQLSS